MSVDSNPIKVCLRGNETKGRLAVMENLIGPDWDGPPLHIHPSFDETFYVLEGELTFQLGDERLTRGAEEFCFASGDVPHTYANHSGREARLLLLCTPAGWEAYFDRLIARSAGVEPPNAREPLPEVTTLGPPMRRT